MLIHVLVKIHTLETIETIGSYLQINKTWSVYYHDL